MGETASAIGSMREAWLSPFYLYCRGVRANLLNLLDYAHVVGQDYR